MICSDIWNKYHEWYGFQQKLLDRVRTESWIHEKVWKRDVKSLKDGKKSWVFFKATTSGSEVKFFSCWSNLILSRLHVMEKAFFCIFLRSLLITYFITLSLEKEIIVLEKVWKKSWILDRKSVRTLLGKSLFVVQMTGPAMSRCINA